ncbi:MAG: helix-turn-helix domain-containing protein [Candidatus Brocadiales bacterium]|nr:helix-turn-helix domain-containing protein [Candidatus Bathyanammoxibius sp.]
MASLLKTEAAADFLSMSPGTLRWWRSIGRGPPFVKCGDAVRYRAEDLEAWVSSRVVKPERESIHGGS